MYSNESILFLIDRIGWGKPLNSDFEVTINISNLLANSGRTVLSFHQLASVENIYSNISEIDADEVLFNQLLFNMRQQSVIEVLTAIMDSHKLYKDDVDYSNVIVSKARLFDEAIGYAMAVKCLELFVSSTRSNATERSNAMSFNTLKIELEGAKNDNGHFIAKGIVYKKEQAIKKAQKIIFPDPILIIGGNDW